ncbi:MAG: thioredoxin-disulfide reductase [Alphaproteobacteria bacterium]
MTAEERTKVLILGSGPAGYTAAIYATRANLEPIIIDGMQPGGQMTITTDVENYPGFAETIQGPWLMEQMRLQAEKVGTRLIGDTIVRADLSRQPFTCAGDSGAIYRGETLVISTGALARWLGLESEERFKGFGLSACATCDGFFFRGKDVFVVGGGNTAVTEALYLANLARRVTLVHRRDSLRAEKLLQERLFAAPNISIIWDHVVDEIVGEAEPPSVTGVRLRHVKSGELQEVRLDGLFIAIGHTPNTELFAGQIEMDAAGYIITQPGGTATSRPGVFAAGDVQDKVYRQAATAAGTGCMAALDAERFLAESVASPVAAPSAAE